MRHSAYIVLLIVFSFLFSCKQDPGETSAEGSLPAEILNGLTLKEQIDDQESTYNSLLETIYSYSPALNKTKTIGKFSFEASYQPHLLLAIKNNDSIQAGDALSRKQLGKVSDYNALHYIQFTIENKAFKSELLRYNISSAQDYSDRIMYYSFYCNNDTYVIENGKDTLKAAFVHFERTFDVSPKLNMTFVFKSKNTTNTGKLNFVFEDRIFNNGKIDFEFDCKIISGLNASEIKKLVL